MLDKIQALALEKCAGDKELADEFVKGFIKAAMEKSAAGGNPFSGVGGGVGAGASPGGLSWWNRPLKENRVGDHLLTGLGQNIGKGLGSLLVGAGVSGVLTAASSIRNQNLHSSFLESLETVIKSNPIVRQAKKDRVVSYAETVFKYAPHVAVDPNLLSSILANAVHGEGIDVATIKTLTDLEKQYMGNNTESPKNFL